jgi:hypothetical protein
MSKSNSRSVAAKPSRIKTAVVISPEAFRRLGAACLAENLSQSEIVEALINRALSGYVVSVRGQGFHAGQANPAASVDRRIEVADVNLTAGQEAA